MFLKCILLTLCTPQFLLDVYRWLMCVRVCMCVYVCTYLYMLVCVYMCICVCMCVCMCVRMSTLKIMCAAAVDNLLVTSSLMAGLPMRWKQNWERL